MRFFSRFWRLLRECLPRNLDPSTSEQRPYEPLHQAPNVPNRYEPRQGSPKSVAESVDLPESIANVHFRPEEDWKELEEIRNQMMHPPRNRSIDNYSNYSWNSSDSGFVSSSP